MSENILRVVTFIKISVPSLFWLVSFFMRMIIWHLAEQVEREEFDSKIWREREEKNHCDWIRKMCAIELVRLHLIRTLFFPSRIFYSPWETISEESSDRKESTHKKQSRNRRFIQVIRLRNIHINGLLLTHVISFCTCLVPEIKINSNDNQAVWTSNMNMYYVDSSRNCICFL